MRPTNRHQRFSHSARKTPRPPRHSLARAKTLAGVRDSSGSREDSKLRARPRAATSKACEGLRRPPRPQAAVSGCPGTRGAVPSLGALAKRGTDLQSLERRARKRSRALRAVAAWFRTVSVTIQNPVPPRSASQSASASAFASASALRPAFSSALRIAFHCVCDYCEVLANSAANSANSANQACASIASCEAREDREAP
ncbi:hypothetical protein NUW54_g14453 [Trametes sanguinea]|uniref:Uncharacterized protein n=1 Tax=Trametes sanguinea TaxID=158606 RepID=A0ACC1MC63_9APHY|nr:hypothetical protein NUW54_g14453 [Trametes sanguinea]